MGTDGWVTPETYAAFEADGFSGRATGGVLTEERLATDLAAWRPELGEQGKDLAYANPDAADHARELVELWRRIGAPTDAPPEESAELGRLARVAAGLERRALEAASEAAIQRAKAERLRAELDSLKATRRYRLAGLLARPLDLLRRPGGRRASRD